MGPDGDRGVGFAHMERTTINNIMQKSLTTKAGCRRWRTRPIDEAGDTLGWAASCACRSTPRRATTKRLTSPGRARGGARMAAAPITPEATEAESRGARTSQYRTSGRRRQGWPGGAASGECDVRQMHEGEGLAAAAVVCARCTRGRGAKLHKT